MSTEGLIVILFMLLIAAFWVVLPLLNWRQKTMPEASVEAQKERETLLARYAQVITNIRDLDDDAATGKIQPADYEQERDLWKQRGVQILQALDALDHRNGDKPKKRRKAAKAPSAATDTADDAVEAAIADYRKKSLESAR